MARSPGVIAPVSSSVAKPIGRSNSGSSAVPISTLPYGAGPCAGTGGPAGPPGSAGVATATGGDTSRLPP